MKKLFPLLVVLLFSFSTQAQVGSATDAMGGTGIGAAHPLDSATLNPAALAQLERNYFSTGYHRRNYLGQDNLDQFSVTVTDTGKEAVFPGAFVYRQRRFDFGQQSREHLFLLSASVPLSEKFSLGLSGYWQRTKVEVGEDYDQKNLDLGLFWKPLKSLSVGLVSRALLGSEEAQISQTQFIPAGGVGIQYEINDILRARYDALYHYEQNPNNRWVHSVGAEFMMRGDFLLRAGLKSDDFRGETFSSVGLSWEGPRLRISYAYQDEVRHDLGSAHTVDIWLNL